MGDSGRSLPAQDFLYGTTGSQPTAMAPLRLCAVGLSGDALLRLQRVARAAGVTVEQQADGGWPLISAVFDLIWLKVAGSPAEELMCRMDEHLEHQGRIVVDCDEAAIDALWSRHGAAEGVTLLFHPEDVDVFAALGASQQDRAMAVHADIEGAIDHQQQLQRLQDEVARIARTLARLHEPETRLLLRAADGSREPPSPFIEDHVVRAPRHGFAGGAELAPLGAGAASATPPLSARDVRRIIRMRRVRDQFFDAEIFADPAWDMLLDLYAARLEHARVAVSSLCIAAAVPATTALRWIKALSSSGLFVRKQDPHDGRRVFVALSDSATAAMHGYFAQVAEEGAVI